jgi:hypothetical protein
MKGCMGGVGPKAIIGFGIFTVLTIVPGSEVPVTIEIFKRWDHGLEI